MLLFSCKGGTYAKGGRLNKETGVDLFSDNDGNDIPPKVLAILDKYENGFIDGDYDELTKANDELYKIGYTFESGLDGQAYDLRKIGQKGKISGYAKGGEMDNEEELYLVVGKKNGQLVDISELPMTKYDAKKFISEQGIEIYYTNVDIVRYRGTKPRHKFMAKGGKTDHKPMSYYKYATPKVRIYWKGKVQPLGVFKSAEEAYVVIKKQYSDTKAYGTHDKMSNYEIHTPDKIIKLDEGGKMA